MGFRLQQFLYDMLPVFHDNGRTLFNLWSSGRVLTLVALDPVLTAKDVTKFGHVPRPMLRLVRAANPGGRADGYRASHGPAAHRHPVRRQRGPDTKLEESDLDNRWPVDHDKRWLAR